MKINDKKIRIIEKLLAVTNAKLLDDVDNLLNGNTSNLSDEISTLGTPTSDSVTNTNISVEAVKNLDNLIAQNMPELNESLSIDEIRAMAAEAEARLKK